MMAPRLSGERALRALEQDMPWLANREIPRVDPSVFMVGQALDGSIVAVVLDEANGAMRELLITDGSITFPPSNPGRLLRGAVRSLLAPWN